jgi:hypothetical protein
LWSSRLLSIQSLRYHIAMDSRGVSNGRSGWVTPVSHSEHAGDSPDPIPVEVSGAPLLRRSLALPCCWPSLHRRRDFLERRNENRWAPDGRLHDKIEVETSCGKVQLNRGDIVTISFPENSRANESAPTPAELVAPKIDESLNGVQYINRTGKFVMTLPRIGSSAQSCGAPRHAHRSSFPRQNAFSHRSRAMTPVMNWRRPTSCP